LGTIKKSKLIGVDNLLGEAIQATEAILLDVEALEEGSMHLTKFGAFLNIIISNIQVLQRGEMALAEAVNAHQSVIPKPQLLEFIEICRLQKLQRFNVVSANV
jgi:hypothetical protein